MRLVYFNLDGTITDIQRPDNMTPERFTEITAACAAGKAYDVADDVLRFLALAPRRGCIVTVRPIDTVALRRDEPAGGA